LHERKLVGTNIHNFPYKQWKNDILDLQSVAEANTCLADGGNAAGRQGLLLSVVEKAPELEIIDQLIGAAERKLPAVELGIEQEGGLGLLEILLLYRSGTSLANELVIQLALESGKRCVPQPYKNAIEIIAHPVPHAVAMVVVILGRNQVIVHKWIDTGIFCGKR